MTATSAETPDRFCILMLQADAVRIAPTLHALSQMHQLSAISRRPYVRENAPLWKVVQCFYAPLQPVSRVT